MKIQKHKFELDTWYSPKRFMREYLEDYFWLKKGDKIYFIVCKNYYPTIKQSILKHRKSGPAIIYKNGNKDWLHKNRRVANTEEEFWNV